MAFGRQTFGGHSALKPLVHLALAGALVVPGVPAWPQDTVTPIGQMAVPPPAASGPAVLTRAQIEAMVAPVALYPDQLLTEILMAAAYPQEVAEADRWVKDPARAGLRGAELEAALAPVDWDPSVKSLVPFPQVLATMTEHLDWTQALGAAFIAQQADVLDAVQHLRREAQAAGYLRSTPQMTVTEDIGAVVIAPGDPTLLYVPVYDPYVVYGAWPYAAYPPVVIYRPRYYAAPIFFGAGFVIVRSFWNWHGCDWRQQRVWIDPPRVNAINAVVIARQHRPPVERGVWQVDAHHRGGAAPAAAAAGAAPPRSGATWRRASDPPARAPAPAPRSPSPSHPTPRSLAVVPPPVHAAPPVHFSSPAHTPPPPPVHAAPPVHFSSPAHTSPPPSVHAAPPVQTPPHAAPHEHAAPPSRSSSDRHHGQ